MAWWGSLLLAGGLGGGTVYTDSISESATATDSLTVSVSSSRTISESASATDSQTGNYSVSVSLSESATGSDSQTGSISSSRTLSESATGSDSQTGNYSTSSSLSEPASGTDSATVTNSISRALSEPANGTDSQTANYSTSVSLSESNGSSDSQTVALTLSATLSESTTASDSQSSIFSISISISESANGSDSQSNTLSASRTLSEPATGSDSQTGNYSTFATITESGSGSDTQNRTLSSSASITESTSPTGSESGNNSTSGSLSESTGSTDSQIGLIVFPISISESTTSSETQSATNSIGGLLTESTTASDSISVVSSFNVSVSELITASDSQIGSKFVSESISESTTASDSQSVNLVFSTSLTELVSATDLFSVNLSTKLIDGSTASDSQVIKNIPILLDYRTDEQPTNSTTYSITLPPYNAGDLLIGIISAHHDGTIVCNDSSWTKLGQESHPAQLTGAIFYKLMNTSTVVDTSVSFTNSLSEQFSSVTYKFKNAGLVTGSATNGKSADSDPPSHTATAGLKDYFWIATRHGHKSKQATAPPFGFWNFITQNSTGTNGACTAVAQFEYSGLTLDPGAFTSPNDDWVSWTIAIAPLNIVPATINEPTTATDSQTAILLNVYNLLEHGYIKQSLIGSKITFDKTGALIIDKMIESEIQIDLKPMKAKQSLIDSRIEIS